MKSEYLQEKDSKDVWLLNTRKGINEKVTQCNANYEENKHRNHDEEVLQIMLKLLIIDDIMVLKYTHSLKCKTNQFTYLLFLTPAT